MKRTALLLVVLTTLISSLQAQARHSDSDFRERQRERMKERRKEKERKKKINRINWSANYQDLLNENGRFFQRLFRRHDAGRIIGLELIIASSSWSNIESGFGHTMLRFVDDIGTESDDVVLSFVANVDSVKLNYVKGIFGGYPVFPQVKSLRLFMDEYNNRQKRDLDRYIIISNEEIRNNVINELKEQWRQIAKHRIETHKGVMQETVEKLKNYSSEKYGQGQYGILPLRSQTGSIYALSAIPKKTEGQVKTTVEEIFPLLYDLPQSSDLGDYTFFANNCAGALVNFFKQVGLPYHKSLGIKGRIPLALPKYLKRALVNPYPIIKIKSLRELKEKVVEILDLKDIDQLRYDIKPEQVKVLINKLTLNEIRKLNEIVSFDLAAFNEYKAFIKKTDRIGFDELHGLEKVPANLYEICNNSKCESEIKTSLESFYGKGTLAKIQEEGQKLSKREIIKWKRDHRTKRRVRVYTDPYEGLLVNKEILDHQKRFYLLHERW
ncbi:DUF4105 domain-containing protein [Halobacteriovorax vibrionivorans]|uniref:DUF4105 domain-containing protein n=1 Tax=Halobacteriovorax vibrionivorans TaxID=2152716 RepID=A0ABY0IEU9_9BACT|nr:MULTISPECIES: DUF4105 domain-containing protein [Halobacteriovorax]RZF21464.1 DUF4105 domain-containing protein [Halobacteriovorax vibrionivorans]TGD48737.1 DUF4105 domain-containing protein [Halobacteriovorax sp. Y22]